MKNSTGKFMAVILLFTLFNVFMVSYVIGTTQTQLMVTPGSSGGLGSLEEEASGPYPEIWLDNCEGAYAESPTIYPYFLDDNELDSAYYQVDSNTPTGTDIENWTMIFEDLGDKAYSEEFTMDTNIFYHLLEGIHSLYLKVWDTSENVTSVISLWPEGNKSNWLFFKDTIAPTYVHIISPQEDEEVRDDLVLEVEAYDNDDGSGIAEVKFYTSEGDFIAAVTEPYEGGHYKKVIDASEIPAGTYTIYAVAYDCAWNKIESETVTFTKPSNTLLIVLISVGAIAGVATTMYVVKYRHRPSAYEKTVSKLGHVKQPMPSKLSATTSSESGEPLYLLPEESVSMREMSEVINQIPLSETQKQELSIELQGIPNEERIAVLQTIIGPIAPIEAKAQLNSLISEIEHLEQEEKWSELMNKLDKGVELAEFLGDQTILNKFLTKIDEIQAHSN